LSLILLKKFSKDAEELISIIDQWTYFIKNAENLDVVPDTITDEGLKDAFEQANKHNWTAQELEDYNKVFIREQDERGRLELAEDKGIKKGKIEMASLMKAEDEPIEKIIKYTGLTKEEVERLSK
jgi:predicted transposase/invertase (TIGR01784 family)